MKALKLEVIFGSKNNLSPALKTIIGSSNAASRALKKTRDEIKALNDQQRKIDGYLKQKKATEDSAKALRDLQVRIKDMRRQISTNPSASLTKEFDQAVVKAQKLKQQYEQNRIQLQRMRTEMKSSGLSTSRLAEHQQRLRTQLSQSNQAMREQEQRLHRMNQMQKNHHKTAGSLRSTAMYGMGAAMTGGAALYQMRKPIEESKKYDIEQNRIAAIGLGDDVAKKAIKYAAAMDTFGTSILDNTTLVRDGMTIFSDLHHAEMVAPVLAKMKFANEAMFGQEQGGENERKFMDMLKVIELRGGLKSEQSFNKQANMIQQVITATGGRVEAPEWLNAIKTGGIAVKGMSDEALYYKMESIVQEWGGFRYGTAAMSAYQNIYQGRTTKRAANNMERLGLIEDPSKLKHDKSGQISFLDVGAIKGAALFKQDQFEWMQQVLLPTLAKKGITEKGDVLDAIGSIFTNRTASSLFSDMYLQRDIINKSAKMNAGADNIDQITGKAKNTAAGKELDAKAKLHDAYLTFGQTILPVYTQALEIATSALKSFTGWMERNPTLTKLLGVGLLTIAVSLVAIGTSLAIFSPLILGMLSLKLMTASASASAGVLARIFGFLPKIFNLFKFALIGVAKVFLWLGRMMLANPILLAITAIAVAAYLIYKYWEPIKAFFLGLWTSIAIGVVTAWQAIAAVFAPVGAWFSARMSEVKTAFSSGIKGLSLLIMNWSPLGIFHSVFAKVLSWFGIDLPAKFTGFGQMIVDGLINGIKSKFESLKNIWSVVNSWIPDFTRKTMDIHSPSRVMAGLGGHIMSGLSIGLDNAFPNLKSKFSDVLGIFKQNDSEVLQKINVAPALSKIQPSQSRPIHSRGDVIIQGDTITMHIQAQQGQSLQQIAQVVEQMLNRREQNKMARARSSFLDRE